MAQFNVYLVNELNGSQEEKQAQERLMEKFQLTQVKLDKLLSRHETIIKTGLDNNKAEAFRNAIESCGYKARVERPLSEELELEPQESEKATQAKHEHKDDIYQPPESTVGNTVYCRSCGAQILDTDDACHQCGEKVITNTGRSKVATGFLAFFFGGFGIHRFYLHQWWGIFYIPLGLFGISPLVTWIEAIYFWACPQERWQRKYGHLPPSSVIVWVVICIIPFIAILGILAAVALPAYQDYTIRAKVAAGLVETQAYVQKVEKFTLQTNFVPNSTLDTGIDFEPSSENLKSVEVSAGGIVTATFTNIAADKSNKTIVFTPSFESEDQQIINIEWSCTEGTLEMKYRPVICRPW